MILVEGFNPSPLHRLSLLVNNFQRLLCPRQPADKIIAQSRTTVHCSIAAKSGDKTKNCLDLYGHYDRVVSEMCLTNIFF